MPHAHSSGESVSALNHLKRGFRAFEIGAATTLLALGAYEAVHFLGDVGPDIGINFGSTRPTFDGKSLEGSGIAVQEPLPYCPYKVEEDTGVVSHNQTIGAHIGPFSLYLSGFEANHLYPTEKEVCSVDPIDLKVKPTYNADGVIDAVTVKVPVPESENPGLDFNDGQVLCMPLPANATLGEVRLEASIYNKAKAEGQTLNCHFGTHATGLGVASDQDPANNIYPSLQAAEDAGIFDPLSNKIMGKVIHNIHTETLKYMHKEYPTAATVHLIMPSKSALSPFAQVENSWDVQSADIMNGAKSVSLTQNGNATELQIVSRYDGIPGSVQLSTELNQTEDNEVDGLIKHTEAAASLVEKS